MIVEIVMDIPDEDRYDLDRIYWLKQTSLSFRSLTKKEWPETGQSAYKQVRSIK
jgi:hypothetical protein